MLVFITVFSGLVRGRFGDASYYITEIQNKEPRNHGTLLFGNAYKNTINVLGGFEPPTDGLEGHCSIQLSYQDTFNNTRIIISK